MIHLYDDDPRQVTDKENYPLNHGSFSEVAINLNKALRTLGYFSEPDQAEWVGACASLGTRFRYRNKKNFIIHVYETTSLPIFVYQNAVACQDRIFGLSNQITKLWHRYGRSDVVTIYGGCDTEFWHPSQPKNQQKFQFCHVNSSNVRSGLDLTIQAFSLAFRDNQDVCLVIKDTNEQKPGSPLLQQIDFYRQNFHVDIIYISERKPMTWIRDLYSSSHVTLNVLRSTSFGMPLLECGACGSLCVTGDIEPTNELVRPTYGVLVPPTDMVKLFETAKQLEREWGLLNCFGDFPHIEEPYFANFKVDVYAYMLLDLFQNWSKYSKIDTRTPINKNWSWQKSAQKLKEQLYGI